MPRYVAFLRGVSPLVAKNLELKRAFEQAGFRDVKTVLSSGNVAFNARRADESVLARQAEAAMTDHLGRTFYTIVRPMSFLGEVIDADPFSTFDLTGNVKRMVTFVAEPHPDRISLPIVRGDVTILAVYGQDILSAYDPTARQPALLPLIEKIFGKNVTTRTWETVKKCAKA